MPKLFEQLFKWHRPAAVIGFNKIPGLDIYYAADPCFEHKAQTMRNPVYRRTERYKVMAANERAVFEPESAAEVLVITQAQQQDFIDYYATPAERFHLLPPGVSRDRVKTTELATSTPSSTCRVRSSGRRTSRSFGRQRFRNQRA